MREFPWQFEFDRKLLFYPERPDKYEGDILEIGPGHGEFIRTLAKQSPDRRFTAIEFWEKRYNKLIRALERQGSDNVHLIGGRAQIALPLYFRCSSFDRIYVLFPDPWPKRTHALHRLLNVDFLSILASVLHPGGNLLVATDFKVYADWVVENARQVPALESLGQPFVTANEIPDYVPTYFEKKWRKAGLECYYMNWRKLDIGVARPLDSRPD